jgi:hypothetical protein
MGDNELTGGLADWVEVKGSPGHAVSGEIISPRKVSRRNSCGGSLCVPRTVGYGNESAKGCSQRALKAV